MADIPHGSRSRYVHRGCRCAACTVANRDEKAAQDAQRRSERVEVNGRLVHPRAVHGTTGGYRNWGCRCQECTTAHSTSHAAWKARRKEVSNA